MFNLLKQKIKKQINKQKWDLKACGAHVHDTYKEPGGERAIKIILDNWVPSLCISLHVTHHRGRGVTCGEYDIC